MAAAPVVPSYVLVLVVAVMVSAAGVMVRVLPVKLTV